MSKRLDRTSARLRFQLMLPEDVTYANDVRNLIKAGLIRGASFGFRVRPGGQHFGTEGGQRVRTLTDLELSEVSLTPTPAYKDTSVSVRADPAVLELLAPQQNRRQIAARYLQLAVAR